VREDFNTIHHDAVHMENVTTPMRLKLTRGSSELNNAGESWVKTAKPVVKASNLLDERAAYVEKEHHTLVSTKPMATLATWRC
jgi:hypothetical protein